ncbi:hypothetical protein PIB30_094430 [Stylosanthes scabra]|uniref:Uncharacterized protein n=1 Tax=Stylosanthes scabra TaxID=79078 RepID=A0ABU6ZU83_9FABA|nr:hypothetical protein [Stylosanthes scabra]
MYGLQIVVLSRALQTRDTCKPHLGVAEPEIWGKEVRSVSKRRRRRLDEELQAEDRERDDTEELHGRDDADDAAMGDDADDAAMGDAQMNSTETNKTVQRDEPEEGEGSGAAMEDFQI